MLSSLLGRSLPRAAPRASATTPAVRRSYAQGYGDGDGDPKGEAPQKQGANPSAHLEHPGPEPVSEGQGSGGGPTKGAGSSSATSSSSSLGRSSGGGAQPRIHDERAGPSESDSKREDVEKHNRDFESRHDRAGSRDDGKDKVDKDFWRGAGGRDREPAHTLSATMKFSAILVVALAAEATVASSWFTKAAYNKWHETELERWLSDHDIPYPSPADRKDLESIVKDNWQNKVSSPYNDWDADKLQAYLAEKGQEVQGGAEQSKASLVQQVKNYWYETEDKAEEAYLNVKDWIFDSWTESQLKAYLDRHGIPAPQPRTRDTLLQAARSNYETAAKKAGQTSSYPGNWLYESWSESDLKRFLDERGLPAPQPSTRDKLVASVRRNARVASLKASASASSATGSVKATAGSVKDGVSDSVFDTWSDSKIKEWADKNGIKVPQGSKRNELLALARKHKSKYTGENVGDQAASALGAATSKAGNDAAKATDDAKAKADEAFNAAIGTWSDSRLKAYLDARGVPVPQSGKKDELLASVRLNKHKAATGYSAWTFDTWTKENLQKWLSGQSDKASKNAAKKADATREDLLKQAQLAYASASKSSGTAYASVTSALAAATAAAKDTTFDTWTSSELKAYLDGYGVPVPQGTKMEELKALARRQSTYFRYGTASPGGTVLAKLQEGVNWVLEQLKIGAASGRKEAAYEAEKATDYAKEQAVTASHRAAEASQRAKHKVKEEL
ncbi:MAG: hypothetical protein M1832_006089 [Thelocarpon impressellum]|nr:MAG: hypothetical protein M1832_006089 [Thelocarpon impressellum]